MLTFTLSYKAKRKHTELIKSCMSFPGGAEMTINLQLISLNQQFSPETYSRAKFSRSTSRNSHALPSVHLRHYAHAGRLKLWSLFSPLSSFFFSPALRGLYRVLKAIMLGSICPIYAAPSWLRRSFRQWVWSQMLTQIICPMKNSLTGLICGRSHHPLSCRALQWRTSIISQPGMWSSQEEAISFPTMPNPVFLSCFGPFAEPTISFWGSTSLKDTRGCGGMGLETAPSFSTPWRSQSCSQHSILC